MTPWQELFFWIAVSLIFTFYTWGMYLAVMNLKANKKKLNAISKCFAYPLLYVGVTADVLYNLTLGTIIFLELPHQFLLTDRLESHLKEPGWRGKVARWFCRNLLDPFDPKGRHCDAD